MQVLHFLLKKKSLYRICIILNKIIYNMLFIAPVVKHWVALENSLWSQKHIKWRKNTFYLFVRHMVNNLSYSERGYSPLHGLVFDYMQGFFHMHHPTDMTSHIMVYLILVLHWMEWKVGQWVHHGVSIWRPITPWSDALPQHTSN